MGVTGQVRYPPPPRRKKRPAWVIGAMTILTFVALLYLIELVDTLDGHRLDNNGIRPLEADGLWGIIFAPLLHANWQHLTGNAGFLLVLGFLVTLAGMSRFVFATTIIWIVGGFGTWLIGGIGEPPGVNIIGASGLIVGWLTFLLVFGIFTRKAWEIVVGLVVLFFYGGLLLVALAPTYGVSWQGHLCGGIAGVFAAYVLSSPERKAREQRGRTAKPPSLRP